MRRMGYVQEDVLSAIGERKAGTWGKHAGWHWNGWHSTAVIMESLVKRGFVERTSAEHPALTDREYRITPAGRTEIIAIRTRKQQRRAW